LVHNPCQHLAWAEIHAPENIVEEKDQYGRFKGYAVKPGAQHILEECQQCGETRKPQPKKINVASTQDVHALVQAKVDEVTVAMQKKIDEMQAMLAKALLARPVDPPVSPPTRIDSAQKAGDGA